MMTRQSSIIPTPTKKSTEKASCSGSESDAARCAYLLSRITIPAKKAPRAKLTSKTAAAPYAIPTEAVRIDSVKSSRDPVLAICQSTQGMNLRPTTIMMATKATTCSSVEAITYAMPLAVIGSAASLPPGATPMIWAIGGNSTRISTVAMSSTTSQPTEICPSTVFRCPCISRALSSTTVDAQDRHRPKISPEARLHSQT